MFCIIGIGKQELWEWDSGARDLSPEPLVPPTTAPPDAIADLASTVSYFVYFINMFLEILI